MIYKGGIPDLVDEGILIKVIVRIPNNIGRLIVTQKRKQKHLVKKCFAKYRSKSKISPHWSHQFVADACTG